MKSVFFIALVFLTSIAFCQEKDTTAAKPKGKNLILPVAIATPETKFGLGVFAGKFFRTSPDTTVRTSSIQLLGLYTLNSQLLAQTGFTVYFPKEKYIINWFGTYSDWPDKFYGIGNNTPKSNEENYSYKQLYFLPQIVRKIYKRLYAGLTYEYQNVLEVNRPPDDLFDKENVVGRNGYVASGLGPVILWDSRNNAFNPTKGEYFLFSVRGYGNWTGSQYNLTNYNLDYRKFIRTRGDNVFAFQIIGQITSGNVPFRILPYLGGPNLLRGYYLGRYRDKGLIAVQPEYRFNVWKRFGGVAFAGLGEVANSVKNLSIDGIHYSLGAGLRYAIIPKDKLNLRVDAAIGQNSFGFYFIVMEAF